MCRCLSCAPYWGPGPQPRHAPRLGNQTLDPLVHRLVLNPLSHTSQGLKLILKGQHYNDLEYLRIMKVPDELLWFWQRTLMTCLTLELGIREDTMHICV